MCTDALQERLRYEPYRTGDKWRRVVEEAKASLPAD